jgi:ATP-binding cassette subfamily B protein
VEGAVTFIVFLIVVLADGVLLPVALTIMLRIDTRITLAVVLPLTTVVVVAQLASRRLQGYERHSRAASQEVTEAIGDRFGAVQAIQFATAAWRVTRHVRTLNEARRKAAWRERLFREGLDVIVFNASQVGVGIVPLLAGSTLQSGHFTVGDFAPYVMSTWAASRQSGTSKASPPEGGALPLRQLLTIGQAYVWPHLGNAQRHYDC